MGSLFSLKEIVFCLFWRCCQTGSIFHYLDPHHSPTCVRSLVLAETAWGCVPPSPTAHGKSCQRGRHPAEVQLRAVPTSSYTLLPFWQQIVTPTHLHVRQFSVAVTALTDGCQQAQDVPSVSWVWILHTQPCPWLLARIPCLPLAVSNMAIKGM